MTDPGYRHSCPLCGFEFRKMDTACHPGCPLETRCNMVRCPSCGFEFPDEPKAFYWLRNLFRRRRKASPRPGQCSLTNLETGGRARIVRMASAGDGRRNHLAAYGLVPGCEVLLIQRSPAFVLRVDQTELALDEDIAKEIIVKPIDGLPPAEQGGTGAA
jgi:ferrous iron transport protein A